MLLSNGVRDSGSPFRRWGTNPGGESEGFVRPGALRNFGGEALVTGETNKGAYPSGMRPPYTWMMARTSGALAARREIEGVGAFTGSGALGINLEGSATGTGAFTATGALVVSATASITGLGEVSANVLAALAASASISGLGIVGGSGTEALLQETGEFLFQEDGTKLLIDGAGAATLTALGWGVVAISGVATFSSPSYGTGTLEADITPFTELSPQSLASAVWAELLESGYSAGDIMRVMSAALAGEVSGAGTATVTIRDIADAKDRIVASVDGTGNRTAVTLDAA